SIIGISVVGIPLVRCVRDGGMLPNRHRNRGPVFFSKTAVGGDSMEIGRAVQGSPPGLPAKHQQVD
ncbi:MAG: hypothetical protein FWD57_13230, partial [Polyangiaceae bacterium]|nr:hypothetical protein [Polyangiaceae bacterium]